MGRVVFLGMGGTLTSAAFWSLWRAGVEVVGVVKPFPYWERQRGVTRLYRKKWLAHKPEGEPLLDPMSMRRILPALGVDVMEASSANMPEVVRWIASKKPTLLCVASYPHLFKEALLSVAPQGCLNVHPSPLPMYRGPNPLFWMFKEGAKEAGVTVHYLDKGIDTGDIVCQERWPLAWGIRAQEVSAECARRGGPLLRDAVRGIFAGESRRVAQDKEAGSHHARPQEHERMLDRASDVKALVHFVRGMARWMPLAFAIEEHTFDIVDVIDYTLGASIPGEFLWFRGELTLQCADGIVRLKAHARPFEEEES